VWWKVALGAAIVVFGVREMFQDLFHPARSGTLAEWIGKSLFRFLRRWPSMLADAGPLAVVIVIFTWAFLIVTGFAFIYWAAFPTHFVLRTVNQPTGYDDFWWCFYYSLEMLTTLGLGDIQPTPNWLRILSATHTLIGFSLVTASVTWIVLLYPALSRARTLARKIHALADAEQQTGVHMGSDGTADILAAVAEDVIRTEVDLVHFPILFYFYSEDRNASLPDAAFTMLRFAQQGTEPGRDEAVRLSAAALQDALNDLAKYIGERLQIEDQSPQASFKALAKLHLSD
jgi:hypothetical protein